MLWLPIDSQATRTTERSDHPARPGTNYTPCLSRSDQRQRWTQTRSQWIGIRRPGRPRTGPSFHAALKEQGTSRCPNRRSKTARRTEWSLSRQNKYRGTAGQGRNSSQTRERGGSRWPGGVSRVYMNLARDALTITLYRVIVKRVSIPARNFERNSRRVLPSQVATGRSSAHRSS